MANNELNPQEKAAVERAQADQNAFEAWARSEGVIIELAAMDECEDGRFPATYHCRETETAWRAWANKTAPAQGALTDALPELPEYGIENAFRADQMHAYVLADRAKRGQVSDAADAARYRWLRKVGGVSWSVNGSVRVRDGDYDAACDAAIQAQAVDATKGGA